MGIKRLKSLLNASCLTHGVYTFDNVDSFMKSIKEKEYIENISNNNVNNPIKKIRIRNEINQKPYVVAVDAHLYGSSYKRIFKRIEYGFFRQIMLSLNYKIIPLYIFDGTSPDYKLKTVQYRKNKLKLNKDKLNDFINNMNDQNLMPDTILNNIYNITGSSSALLEKCTDGDEIFMKLLKKSMGLEYDDIKNLQLFFDLIGIPYLIAPGEADDLMATLYKNKIIDACQSDDMDMLPKGCGNLIQINKYGVTQYILEDILLNLKMTYDQFIDMCILMGSDYFKIFLPKMTIQNFLETFMLNNSIDLFVEYYSINNDVKIKDYVDSYKKCRQFFNKNITDDNCVNKSILITNLPSKINFNIVKRYFYDINILFDPYNEKKFKELSINVNKYLNILKNGNII